MDYWMCLSVSAQDICTAVLEVGKVQYDDGVFWMLVKKLSEDFMVASVVLCGSSQLAICCRCMACIVKED
jgi:hypothetical protein